MRTFCRRSLELLGRSVLLLAFSATSCVAQTLAHPHWAGSGLAPEAWWRSAVFYEIEPTGFQASGSGSIGDLQGIAQRMDYLQSLGVDAIVLEPPFKDDNFDDLLSEASRRHVRIVIALDQKFLPPGSLQAAARSWLTRGAAGISLHGDVSDFQLHDLRTLCNSFPGQRVLLAEHGNADLVQLQIADARNDASELHQRLEAAALTKSPALLTAYPSNGSRLQPIGKDPGVDKIVAAVLLTSRGAVSLLYGKEIGLEQGTHNGAEIMQWTPSNITPPPAPEEEPEAPKPVRPPPPQDVYGAFVPYVPTRKKVVKPTGPDARPDPNSLRGFTSGRLPESPEVINNKTANVAVEDADPKSLLNFYRRLIQLHHDNASLRTGTPVIFNHDAENAVVWIRRSPTGARAAGTIVVACNLSDKLLTLSIDPDLAKLRIHGGSLRPLAASWTATPFSQASGHIVLPPYSVYVSELYY